MKNYLAKFKDRKGIYHDTICLIKTDVPSWKLMEYISEDTNDFIAKNIRNNDSGEWYIYDIVRVDEIPTVVIDNL